MTGQDLSRLDPMWPLPETPQNLKQPPLRHGVDGSKQPILPNGKMLHYPYPTIWGSYLHIKVYLAMARFASSTANHCCIQFHAGTTSGWPTQAYLNYSLEKKLPFGNWCGSMPHFINPFAIMLWHRPLKTSLRSWPYLDMREKGLLCMLCGQRVPRVWFQTLAADSHIFEGNP